MKIFTAHVDENGNLALGQLPPFPPGKVLHVFIMDGTDVAILGQVIDVIASTEEVNSALLEQLEALDEAVWDAQFAASQDILAELAEQARSEYERSKNKN